MANFDITIPGIAALSRSLLDVAGSIENRKLMVEIGLFLMTRIKLRTAKGVDFKGSFFEPYSIPYAAFRKAEGYQIEKVDLFFTGSMMSSMTQTATKDKVTLFFSNTEDKTGTKNPSKAAWLNEKREFFTLSDKDIEAITDVVDDFIINRMKL